MPTDTPQKSPPWFRFYSEALDDFKLKRVAMQTGQHKMFIMGVWSALLSLANASPERGSLLISAGLPYTLEDIALRIDLDSETCKTLLDSFVANRMIHLADDTYIISNWDHRQFTGDSSNERVRKHREKRKALDLPVAPRYDSNVVLERDGWQCVYCGSNQSLCVDHMYPIDLGGTDHYDNLACACKTCSSGKTGRAPEQAGYRFRNPEVKQRYERYLDNAIIMRIPVTVTQTPPESDTESDTEPEEETPNGVGGKAPTKTPRKKPSTELQKEAQAMFGALASLCEYDLEMISEGDRGKLNQASKIMREKSYKPADLEDFSRWWYAHFWKGQQGQAPTLSDVRENWGRYKAWVAQGKPDPSTKKGQPTNGSHQRSNEKPTGESLEGEPTYDTSTKELVYPDGRRVPY